MKIRMLQTRMGTENGHSVSQYKEGKVYAVTETLARYFFSVGWATLENK